VFPGAPRKLVVLLSILIALRLLFALLEPGVLALSLLKVGFLAFFAWRVLLGKESAAKVLAILLLLGAALDTFDLLRFSHTTPWVLAFLVLPLFHAGVALYIFRSKAVSQFLAKRAFALPYAP
jgi:hypothetical protein